MPDFTKKAPRQVKPKVMYRDTSGRPTEHKLVIDEPLQFNIPKGVEEDKRVNPKKVFEGYKDPKKKKKGRVKGGKVK
tara:strand:+ start:998 stop:1228 length:231 start_codon:yes stop_codon:yes gene_type:complete